MDPLKVSKLYLMDAVKYRKYVSRRREPLDTDPFTIIVGIDTYDNVSEEHMEYAREQNCVEIVKYTTLFGDYAHTFRFRFGPFYQSDAKSEFEKLEKIAKCDMELLLLARGSDPFMQKWTKMFIHLFYFEEL